MCWLVPEQRLITAWDPEGAPADQGPRSGQIATREDGGVPVARSWPGQQGAAKEGPVARAARNLLRARGEAPQVGKCGPELRGAAIPGAFSSLRPRLTTPAGGS